MTFDQIQQAIGGMLTVQRELQNSQLRLSSELDTLKQSVSELTEQAKEPDRRFRETDQRSREIDRRFEWVQHQPRARLFRHPARYPRPQATAACP